MDPVLCSVRLVAMFLYIVVPKNVRQVATFNLLFRSSAAKREKMEMGQWAAKMFLFGTAANPDGIVPPQHPWVFHF